MEIQEFKTFFVINDHGKEFIIKKENCILDLRLEGTGEHYFF